MMPYYFFLHAGVIAGCAVALLGSTMVRCDGIRTWLKRWVVVAVLLWIPAWWWAGCEHYKTVDQIRIQEQVVVDEVSIPVLLELAARSSVFDGDCRAFAGIILDPEAKTFANAEVSHLVSTAAASGTNSVLWCLDRAPTQIRRNAGQIFLKGVHQCNGLWLGVVDRKAVEGCWGVKIGHVLP